MHAVSVQYGLEPGVAELATLSTAAVAALGNSEEIRTEISTNGSANRIFSLSRSGASAQRRRSLGEHADDRC